MMFYTLCRRPHQLLTAFLTILMLSRKGERVRVRLQKNPLLPQWLYAILQARRAPKLIKFCGSHRFKGGNGHGKNNPATKMHYMPLIFQGYRGHMHPKQMSRIWCGTNIIPPKLVNLPTRLMRKHGSTLNGHSNRLPQSRGMYGSSYVLMVLIPIPTQQDLTRCGQL